MESLFCGSWATADGRRKTTSRKGGGADRTVDARKMVDARALVTGLPAPAEDTRRSTVVVLDCRRGDGESTTRVVGSASIDEGVACLERGETEAVDRILGEPLGFGEAATLDATLALRAGGEVVAVGEDANEDLPSNQGSLLIVVRGRSFLRGASLVYFAASGALLPAPTLLSQGRGIEPGIDNVRMVWLLMLSSQAEYDGGRSRPKMVSIALRV